MDEKAQRPRRPRNRAVQRRVRDHVASTGQTYQQAFNELIAPQRLEVLLGHVLEVTAAKDPQSYPHYTASSLGPMVWRPGVQREIFVDDTGPGDAVILLQIVISQAIGQGAEVLIITADEWPFDEQERVNQIVLREDDDDRDVSPERVKDALAAVDSILAGDQRVPALLIYDLAWGVPGDSREEGLDLQQLLMWGATSRVVGRIQVARHEGSSSDFYGRPSPAALKVSCALRLEYHNEPGFLSRFSVRGFIEHFPGALELIERTGELRYGADFWSGMNPKAGRVVVMSVGGDTHLLLVPDPPPDTWLARIWTVSSVEVLGRLE